MVGRAATAFARRQEAVMRGLDCVHEAHEDMHLTAENDEELFQKGLQHRDQYHPEFTDEQIREIVTTSATDE
jgi:hypothetical protein